ncbi:hypothetical protein AA0474_1898 [Acetobacter lovaniensis NRIC 0474]|nr:hypothetical protein AA0474_1898 [Acetobacter lovaniensis NRIC 0474]
MELPRRREGVTNSTNWPNPERPGVPMFPEQDGWHSLRTYSLGLFFWDSANKYWWDSQKRFYRTIPEILKDTVGTKYIGPCLTPTQIDEVVAGERERCVQEALHIGESWDGTELSPSNTARHIAQAIRNLGAAP